MQSWCCQHTSVSRGYRYMRNTQRDNQEAVGNTLSRFFRLKIIRIALQMNPTVSSSFKNNLRHFLASLSFFFLTLIWSLVVICLIYSWKSYPLVIFLDEEREAIIYCISIPLFQYLWVPGPTKGEIWRENVMVIILYNGSTEGFYRGFLCSARCSTNKLHGLSWIF